MSRRGRAFALGLVAVAVVAAPAPASAQLAPADALARIRGTGVLRWGGDLQGGEPYAFEDPAQPGKLAGFEVEIADAIARTLGVRAEFVQNDWSTLVPTLERGSFDVIMNGLEITEARRKRIAFSRPYYVFAERLVVRNGDRRFATLPSLKGARVGTLASSLAWDLLLANGAEAVPYEGVEEPFSDLASGRTDAVLMDDIICDRYGRKPGLMAVGDVAEGQYAIGLRKGDATLLLAIDGALGQLVRSGELRAILKRWRLDGPRQDLLSAEAPRSIASPNPSPVSSGVPTTLGSSLSSRQVWLFLRGALATMAISVAAMALAVAGGLLLAAARMRGRTPLRRAIAWCATAYVEVVRGTPVLLQLYVIYFGLANVVQLPPFAAAILGLGLNYAAYEAEIYRAGIQAVPRGQIEAAEALGMPSPMVFRRVVLPQAFRFSLPGVTNDFIALLKDSSLVSVITVVELTKRMTIVAVDIGSWLVPGALCAALYFAMSYPLSRLSRRLEAQLAGTRG